MRKIKFILSLTIVFLVSMSAQAQYLKFKPFKPYKWMVAVGWNAVDDDGRAFSYMLDYENSWNYLPYPTTLSVDRYIMRGMSIDAQAAFNIYDSTKMINCERNRPGYFGSFDVNFKYSFYKFFQPMKWFDPYVASGIGFVYRESYQDELVPTANITLGMNFWIKNVGIRLQTAGKLGINANIWETDADFVQHSASLVYRFPDRPRKDNSFSKKQYKWTKKSPKYKGGRKKRR